MPKCPGYYNPKFVLVTKRNAVVRIFRSRNVGLDCFRCDSIFHGWTFGATSSFLSTSTKTFFGWKTKVVASFHVVESMVSVASSSSSSSYSFYYFDLNIKKYDSFTIFGTFGVVSTQGAPKTMLSVSQSISTSVILAEDTWCNEYTPCFVGWEMLFSLWGQWW